MKSIFIALVTVMSFPTAFAAKPTDGLPASLLKIHAPIAAQDCDDTLEQGPEAINLGNNRTLYIVPCLMGAYQGSSKAYITVGDTVSQVIVLEKHGSTLSATTDLTEAYYDAKTSVLSTFAKGRGIGDCGQSSQTLIKLGEYGSVDIKTIEIRSKDKCDGDVSKTWPVVFKQK